MDSENGIIEVILHDDNRTITIKDNGCGIILDGESNGKPNWEHAFLILFSGSKMSTGKTSGGTNGCGNTIINYSSDLMDIVSKRNGKIYHIQFVDGGEISVPFECLGDTEEHGTEITFKLCDKIYTNTVFDENEARGIVERIVVTSPNITSIFKYKDQCYSFNFKNLSEYLEFKNIKGEINNIIFAEKEYESGFYNIDKKKDDIEKTKINLVVNFSKGNVIHYPFLNGIYMPQLEENTVHKGVINGLKDSINKYLKENNMYDKGEKPITLKDVEESTSYICDVNSTNVSYTSQTKFSTKKELYENTIKTYIKDFMEVYSIENKEDMDELSKIILVNKRAREKSEETRQKTKSKLSNEIKFTDNIKNFKNCISKDKNITELFLGEGSSAQGGLLQSRDSFFQACFHVGGKMLSLLKAKENKIFANEVVYNLYRVFGCGTDLYKSKYNVKRSKTEPPLPPFNIDNFRWSKVILSTDQDIDAYQIRCLILTCVYRMSKKLIEEGYFYIAEAPLFEITTKEKVERTLYAYTDNEKDNILKELDEQGIKYYPPERNKGLGQMDKDTRAKTMMIPETRRLTKVTVEDIQKMEQVIELWMGDKIDNRKDVITNNFNYVEHFDLELEKDICKIFNENYLPYAIDIVKDRAIIGIDGFSAARGAACVAYRFVTFARGAEVIRQGFVVIRIHALDRVANLAMEALAPRSGDVFAQRRRDKRMGKG
jgi:DNA gyrase subunit B